MAHVIEKRGVLEGTALAVFLALVHTVSDAMAAILGSLLPTLQERFEVGPTVLALIVAVYWIASSATQHFYGALAEDLGLRLVGAVGVAFTALFFSLMASRRVFWTSSSCSSWAEWVQLRFTRSGQPSRAGRACTTARSASASSPPEG